MLSKTTVSIAAAGAGLCFLGYCIYFDRKRRNDPEFKQKLREKRRKAKLANQSQKSGPPQIDMTDPEAMSTYFLKEVQLGEELLATGDIDGGVEHLSNAVVVCGQPSQLLAVLQQTLPPQVYQLLVQKIPATREAMQRQTAPSQPAPPKGPQVMTLAEDDVE